MEGNDAGNKQFVECSRHQGGVQREQNFAIEPRLTGSVLWIAGKAGENGEISRIEGENFGNASSEPSGGDKSI